LRDISTPEKPIITSLPCNDDYPKLKSSGVPFPEKQSGQNTVDFRSKSGKNRI
jgi:hypothetical protein